MTIAVMNPQIFNENGYSFRFYSNDHEPIHVHVIKNEHEAVIELEPIKIRRNIGFNDKELNRIVQLVRERYDTIKKAWNEFFSD